MCSLQPFRIAVMHRLCRDRSHMCPAAACQPFWRIFLLLPSLEPHLPLHSTDSFDTNIAYKHTRLVSCSAASSSMRLLVWFLLIHIPADVCELQQTAAPISGGCGPAALAAFLACACSSTFC